MFEYEVLGSCPEPDSQLILTNMWLISAHLFIYCDKATSGLTQGIQKNRLPTKY